MNPSTRNMKKTTPRHILIKLLKTSDKEKILKAARGEEGKTCYIKGWKKINHANTSQKKARVAIF